MSTPPLAYRRHIADLSISENSPFGQLLVAVVDELVTGTETTDPLTLPAGCWPLAQSIAIRELRHQLDEANRACQRAQADRDELRARAGRRHLEALPDAG